MDHGQVHDEKITHSTGNVQDAADIHHGMQTISMPVQVEGSNHVVPEYLGKYCKVTRIAIAVLDLSPISRLMFRPRYSERSEPQRRSSGPGVQEAPSYSKCVPEQMAL
jgi:hypothetical protein